MSDQNLYADSFQTPDPVIRRVAAELKGRPHDPLLSDDTINHIAEDEVLKLWEQPIKVYIPVLALRAAHQRVSPHAPIIPPGLERADMQAVMPKNGSKARRSRKPASDRDALDVGGRENTFDFSHED